jgi:hypothetical protein
LGEANLGGFSTGEGDFTVVDAVVPLPHSEEQFHGVAR